MSEHSMAKLNGILAFNRLP